MIAFYCEHRMSTGVRNTIREKEFYVICLVININGKYFDFFIVSTVIGHQ